MANVSCAIPFRSYCIFLFGQVTSSNSKFSIHFDLFRVDKIMFLRCQLEFPFSQSDQRGFFDAFLFSTFFWYFIIIYDIWRASRLVVIITRSSILVLNIRRKFGVINGSPKRLIVYCFFGFMIPIFKTVPFDPPLMFLSMLSNQNSLKFGMCTFFQGHPMLLILLIALNIFKRPAHFQAIDHENFKQLKERWVVECFCFNWRFH
jgi:hypothetical protein